MNGVSWTAMSTLTTTPQNDSDVQDVPDVPFDDIVYRDVFINLTDDDLLPDELTHQVRINYFQFLLKATLVIVFVTSGELDPAANGQRTLNKLIVLYVRFFEKIVQVFHLLVNVQFKNIKASVFRARQTLLSIFKNVFCLKDLKFSPVCLKLNGMITESLLINFDSL